MQANNRRIAKNTMVLYVRTIVVMLITLYTSRVVLAALGVDNYGIYNVVGGIVTMFSLISGSLSNAISRFITFELGRGNKERLRLIFCMGVNIQIIFAIVIIILGETAGGWFLNTHMNIPAERMVAANQVLHCSLAIFAINLVSLPYNACIVAHEKMSAFAYISMLDVVLKLLVCYLIVISPYDKLIVYAILHVVIALTIRIIYGLYCRRFPESHYRWVSDRSILREMAGFAGWTYITNCTYLLNTQGVNILVNLFFGVAVNAARGIVSQVNGAIMQFVNNFTMAMNPQITKNYAMGRMQEMFVLMCRGSKFSYFLLLLFALPVFLETEYILGLWLTTVPPHTVAFMRLAIISTTIELLGNTSYVACMATGNIRRYTILISIVNVMTFPFTWVAFKIGMPTESAYVIYAVICAGNQAMRLYVMRGLLHFPTIMYVREVLAKVILVTIVAIVLPAIVTYSLPTSFMRLCLTVVVSLFSTSCTVYLLGFSLHEREMITKNIISKIKTKKS